jgi:hypothetical protein
MHQKVKEEIAKATADAVWNKINQEILEIV